MEKDSKKGRPYEVRLTSGKRAAAKAIKKATFYLSATVNRGKDGKDMLWVDFPGGMDSAEFMAYLDAVLDKLGTMRDRIEGAIVKKKGEEKSA